MKLKILFFSLASLIMLLFAACGSDAQNTKTFSNTASDVNLEVIQFHSEHRCMTCNKIEALTQETLRNYSSIPFSLINVDDAKNAIKAAQFEATGTALFLFNPQTGKKKDMTEFAFMKAGNNEEFIEGLKKEIDLFLKS